MQSEILAQVFRGDTVESFHRGSIVVLDGERNVVFSVGDAEMVTFFRSSAKALQAMPFLTSGAADAFGFLEDAVALACASHSGEKIHTDLAHKMLTRGGFSVEDLHCGAHLPFDEARAAEMQRSGEPPTAVHNNCSGKHAAMLAYAKHIGADVATYERLENPVQQNILDVVSEFTEVPRDEIKIGIDGCALPNFAVPLSTMALTFSKLVFPPADMDAETREACRRIVAAYVHYPKLIGGTTRLDTILMEAAGGKIISKIGAEGVWTCGVLPSPEFKKGLGIAIKIEDGEDRRARPVVAVAILKKLGILEENALPELLPMEIKNRCGDVVGRVEAQI